MSAFSSPTELNNTLTEIGTSMTGKYISLHTASPGTTGANEVTGGTYARVPTTWGAPGGGNPAAMTGTQVTLNVPASTTITHWGIWTALTAGTWVDGGPLPVVEAYGAAGSYLLTPTLNASL